MIFFFKTWMMQKMSWLITREPFQLATNMEKVLNMNFFKKGINETKL